MPTSTTVKGLNINELTEAQYDAAVLGGVIGPNELSIITDLDDSIQVTALPVASVDELDKIYQFVGATDATYTNGYFYKCVSDGQTPATYSWEQTDVQPAGSSLPSQTGHSGEFLTTDGTDASWSDKPLVNTATGTYALTILGTPSSTTSATNICEGSSATGASSLSVGRNSSTSGQFSMAFGTGATASGQRAIQLGSGSNSDANTLKVGNTNGNYEIMSADGTIPTARFTTDPVADGTYVPTLTISSGVATRSWSTPSGGLPSQTGNAGKFLTTDGTDASWSDKPLVNNDTHTGGVSISSNTSGNYNTVLGRGAASYGGSYNTVVGSTSQARNASVAIGVGIQDSTSQNAVIIRSGTQNMSSYVSGITDSFTWIKGTTRYELVSGDGTIPTARLTKVNSTITLAVADWNGGTTVTKTVAGITATGVVLVSPDPTDQSAYTSAGILCTSQATNSLTFTATTTPTADIDVNVVML